MYGTVCKAMGWSGVVGESGGSVGCDKVMGIYSTMLRSWRFKIKR